MVIFPWPGDPPASPEGEADGGQATAREKSLIVYLKTRFSGKDGWSLL